MTTYLKQSLEVQGNTVLEGNTTIGNEITDSLTVTSRIVSGLIPGTTATHDFGSSSLAWNNLYTTTAYVSSLSNTRLTFAGTDGVLTDSANLTFDGTTLTVTGAAAIDNISIDGNTISSTNTNGNILISPDGSGQVEITGDLVVSGTTFTTEATTLAVIDPVITLGGDSPTDKLLLDDNKDRGVEFLYHNGGADVTAGSFVTSTEYVITSAGTTDFTLIGAADNDVGTVFTATGAGTGTGTANETSNTKRGFFGFDDSTSKFVYYVDASNSGEILSGTIGDAQFADIVGSSATVTGTFHVDGASTLATVNVEDLTSGRIVLAGTSGELEDDANFTFDGTTFTIGSSTFTVAQATGNTNIAGTLDVTGDVNFNSTTGSTTSSTGAVVIDGGLGVAENVRVGTAVYAPTGEFTTGNITDLNVGATGLDVTGPSTFNGNVTLGDASTDTVTFTAKVDSNILVDTNNAYDLGDATNQLANVYTRSLTTDGATAGNVQVGVTSDNEIDTTSGNLTLDSAGGTVVVDDILSVSGTATFSSDVTFTGATANGFWDSSANKMNFADNATVTFGAGDDVTIYHDITDSHIVNSTGELYITSDNLTLRSETGTEVFVDAEVNGAVTVYHNNAAKLATTATGIDVTGTAVTDGLTVAGTSDLSGDVTLGNVNTDTLTVTAKVGSHVLVDTDNTYDIGDATNYVRTLYARNVVTDGSTFGNIQVAVTDDNTIDTTSGNMTIASTGGTTTLSDNVVITGTIDANSTSDFGGNVVLSAASDFTMKDATPVTPVDVFTVDGATGNTAIAGTLGVTGESTLASATVSDLTDNRVVIAGLAGSLEDDANFTFDGTTLAVGGSNFTVAQATGNTSVAGTLGVTGESTLASATVSDLTDNRIVLAGASGALEDDANFTFDGTNFAIGLTNFTVAQATGNTSVAGTLGVTGESTLASATVSDLTAGRVVLAGTAGSIEDSGNLTFSGTLLTVTGNATVTGTLDVDTNATLASVAVEDLTAGRVVLAGTGGEIEDSSGLTFNGTTLTANAVTVTTNIGVTGTLDVDTSATLASVNVEDLTSGRVVLAGTSGELEDSANFTFDGTTLTVTGAAAIDNVTIDGNTISSTDLNGNIVLDPNGTGQITLTGPVQTTGAADFDSTATFSGNVTLDSDADFTVTNTAGPTNVFTIDGATGDTYIDGDLDVNGTISGGVTIGGLTEDRVTIAGVGGALEDDANFTFDGTELAVGVTNFTVAQATGNVYTAGTLHTDGQATFASANVEDLTSGRVTYAGTDGELQDNANFTFDGTTVTANALTVSTNATVSGTLDVDTNATIASAVIEDLTDNRVVIAGTGGELEDDANFTFDGTELSIGAGNFTVQHATGNVYTAGNLEVNGNITVNGTTTTVNSTTVQLDDPVITLGGDTVPTVDDNKDRGVEFRWHNGVAAKVGFFGFDDSTGKFTFIPDATNTAEVFSGAAGDAVFNSVEVTSFAGGDIQIGVTASNEIDTTAGNLILDSTGGTVQVDDDLDVTGSATLASAAITDLTSGRVVLAGTSGELEDSLNLTFNGTLLTVTGNATVTGTLDVDTNATLASVAVEDLTDNRIVIAGTGGELEDDANLTFDGTTFEVGAAFDVIAASGNTTVGGTFDVTGAVNLNDTTGSTSSTTGALIVDGGVGIAENLYVGGNLNVGGTLTIGGNSTAGDADTDSLEIIADLISNITPNTTDTYDLGETGKAWRDLYLSESVTFEGATGENEIVFPTNLADGLSITDGTSDFIVLDSTTAANKVTIVPDLELSGALTTSTVNGDYYAMTSETQTLATVSETAIASFAAATYGAAKFIVTAKDGVNRTVTEILVTHDGTTAVATEYAIVSTSTDLATYDVDISGGNVRLLATSASVNSTVYNVVETLIDA